MITLSFKEAVADLTRRIDTLVFKLGGTGGDLQEKARSIQHLLDEYELRQLRFVAIAGHKIVHHADFRIKGDPQQFVDTCQWLVGRLEAHVKTQDQHRHAALPRLVLNAPASTHESSHPNAKWIPAGVGGLCLVVFPFVFTRTVGHSQWPPSVVLVEEVANWPLVIFWTVMVTITAHYAVKFIARRFW